MASKNYCYLFTRQDISNEQQLVQTAHVALKLGVKSEAEADNFDADKDIYFVAHRYRIDPDETYFSCIGVRNLDALEAVQLILEKFNYKHEVFYEPDMRGEPTSIAVYPIAEYDRGPLLAFNRLKMEK